MKNLIWIIAFSTIPIFLYAQIDEENAVKYAFYKKRLQEDFMRTGPSFKDYSDPEDTIPYFLQKDITKAPKDCVYYEDQDDDYIEGLDIKKIPAFGYNHPAAVIGNYGTNPREIFWSDGTEYLSYYIGVLATEYLLLKRYKQDYSQTRMELLRALEAVDRLDTWAEYFCYGPCEPSYDYNPYKKNSDTKNGFFIRDDVTEWIERDFYLDEDRYSFIDQNKDEGTSYRGSLTNTALSMSFNGVLTGTDYEKIEKSKYIFFGAEINGFKGSYMLLPHDDKTYHDHDQKIRDPLKYKQKEMSKDHCWYLFGAFALVRACVDDKEILDLTTDLTCRIYDYLNPDGLRFLWFIRNPVDGKKVPRGNYAGREAIGFGLAAEYITDGKSDIRLESILKYYQQDESNYKKDSEKLLSLRLLALRLWYPDFISELVFFLPTHFITMNIPVSKQDRMARLPIILLSAISDLWDYKTVKTYTVDREKYEYLLLQYCLMHNESIDVDASYFRNILKTAPCGGPYCRMLEKTGDRTWTVEFPDAEWRYHNRLHRKKGAFHERGYLWPGMDYMLLHNLFYLNYPDEMPPFYNMDNANVEQDYPYLNTIGTKDDPVYISSFEKITANNTISKGADVTYTAGKEIEFEIGFTVQSGAEFQAYAKEITCVDYSTPGTGYGELEDVYINDPLSDDEIADDYIAPPAYEINEEVTDIEQAEEPVEYLSIYPNPSNTLFNISYRIPQEANASVLIFSMLGHLVYEQKLKPGQNIIRIHKDKIGPKGIYTCIIMVGGVTKYTEKLMILE